MKKKTPRELQFKESIRRVMNSKTFALDTEIHISNYSLIALTFLV